MRSWLLVAALGAVAATVSAGEKPMAGDEFIEVKVQGRLAAGIMAIGGETTGYTITARGLTWELDFGSDTALRGQADSLDGQRVVVTGAVESRRGVERGPRTIVRVKTLARASGTKH